MSSILPCRILRPALLALASVGAAGAALADPLPPQMSASRSLMSKVGLVGPTQGIGEDVADLFVGRAAQRIPLELPPGRRGHAPAIALTYSSDGANGWVGQGWDLELPAIERNRRYGVGYGADDYVLRLGSTVELVNVSPGEYRAKIQGDFARVKKVVSSVDGRPSWEVLDRNGVRYVFGRAPAARQDNAADATQVFRWCLERVEDPNGNYYTVSYFKHQGAIYPDVVSYTGNGSLAPSTTVRFWRDAGGRADVPTSYATGFGVRVAYRLQSVEVRTNGVVDRIYALEYGVGASTSRAQLSAVRRIGSDGVVGAGGIATGTALPAQAFTYTAGAPPSNDAIAGPSVYAAASTTNVANPDPSRLLYGDFNGDGRTDVAYVDGRGASAPMKIFLSTGKGFAAPLAGPVRFVSSSSVNAALNDIARVKLGDFNGDGRTDLLAIDGASGTVQPSVYLANADGSFPELPSFKGPYVAIGTADVDVSRVMLGDFDGDGRTDLLYVAGTTASAPIRVHLSTGDGFGPQILGPNVAVTEGVGSLARVKLGDFDGNGKTDVALVNGYGQTLPMSIYSLDAAKTSLAFLMNGPSRSVRADPNLARIDALRIMTGDVNGDGKTDLLALEGWGTTAPMSVFLATGTGFAGPLAGPSRYFDPYQPDQSLGRPRLGDFNGDGMLDLAFVEGTSGASPMSIYLSEGYRFTAARSGPVRAISGGTGLAYELPRVGVGDFDGDGRTDFIGNDSVGTAAPTSVYLATGEPPDLLASVSNGIGGVTTITYVSSVAWANAQLPFPRETVSAATVDDGNGVVATTTFSYSGGYYHLAEREFRGFERVDVTAPAGPDGEQAQTRYWFHQGNDVAVDANTPGGAVGYAKGKPYRVQTWDLQGSAYSETETTYWPASAAPYFTPVQEVRTRWCEQPAGRAPACGRSTRTTFAEFDASGRPVSPYDAYGNARRENRYGDEADATDDVTIVRTFSPNQLTWIVGLPATEKTYAGAGATTALTLDNQLAGSTFTYDGTLDPATCASSGATATPTRGNRTKVVRLLKGGTDPEEWTGYDAYGNVVCESDADRRVTSYGYDGSATFRTSETNAKRHVTATRYYGVDGVPLDLGRYGEPKTITDPNLAETGFEYDGFGRQTKETKPPVAAPLAGDPYPGFTTTTTYQLGGVDINRVETLTSAGEWKAESFDGLGRTYLVQKKGSSATGARVIATRTEFNATGTQARTSLPHDLTDTSPRWKTFGYDAQGRVRRETKPDGTATLTCYRDVDGSSASIDANGHRRRTVKDVRGSLVRVQEYRGTFSTCSTDEGTPYATTRYVHDRMGRLTTTIDAEGAQSVIDYDTLARRSFASDPDLGTWYFGYTQAGDVLWQQDANGTNALDPTKAYKTHYEYDELHRLARRYHLTVAGARLGADDSFGYDDPAVPYSLGRTTSMTDASGTTSYGYDAAGRPWSTVRTIGGVPYTTLTGYDAAGRVSRETYPDAAGSVALYEFDADGFLAKVSLDGVVRAELTGYNALGQVGTIAYGNGTRTRYTYNDAGNHRVHRIVTSNAAGTLLDLTYGYDDVRNVVSVADGVNAALTQAFGYDELNRLTSASSAALGALAYAYGPTGNLLAKEGVTYTYDAVKVHAAGTTSDGRVYAYDANGNLRSDGTRTLEWDLDNRPAAVSRGASRVVLAYDGNGRRVTKQAWSGDALVATTTYVGRLYECTNAACTRHLFAGDRRVASFAEDGTARYHHVDHLSSTRLTTDEDGVPTEPISYRPFGESASGESHYRFTGKELDAETGLYDYGARSYDPGLGRFISPDPSAPTLEDPQSLNRYAYARNNPIFFNDPSGYSVFDAQSIADRLSLGDFASMLRLDGAGVAVGSAAGSAGSPGLFGMVTQVAKDTVFGTAKEVANTVIGVSNSINQPIDALLSTFTDFRFGRTPEFVAATPGERGAMAGVFIGSLLTPAGELRAAAKVGRTVEAVKLGEYTMTRTVANHLGDVVKHGPFKGELARPYLNSPLTFQEIMAARKPIPDPGGVAGALRWDVPGTVRGTAGTWELVVEPQSKTILHWLFRPTP